MEKVSEKRDDRGWKELEPDLKVVIRQTALAFVGYGLMCSLARRGLTNKLN